MIAFLHVRATENVGDLAATPAHYFNFPDPRLFDIRAEVPECDAAIFGGGAIEPILRNEGLHRRVPARRRIAWGIGSSTRGQRSHRAAVADLDLVGLREHGREGGVYVPCASCMLPLLDRPYPIRHEAVMFVNADPNVPAVPIRRLPTLDNTASIEATIAWLGSGAVVVTNSYHGVYWASLLGRRVVCLPYSSKFFGFKFPPAMLDDGESWITAAARARPHPEALEDCRHHNLAFHQQVTNLLE